MYKSSWIYADREIREHEYTTNICTITTFLFVSELKGEGR